MFLLNKKDSLLKYLNHSGRVFPLIVYLSLGLGGLLFLASMYQRSVFVDEPWIGEQAYWAAKDQVVRSELFRGFYKAEVKQLAYHKLFVWQAAGVIQIFGWSIYVLKFISFFYLAAFIILSYFYLQRLPFQHKSYSLFFFYSLLLANALISEYAFIFRPEVMLMVLGFGSWLCLQRVLTLDATKPYFYSAMAGLLAGLAALAHLNGLIFILAGAGLLLLNRQVRPFLLFSGAAGLGLAGYFMELLNQNDRYLFLAQIAPAFHDDTFEPFVFLVRVLNEHKRFFHSMREASFSVLLLVAGFCLYKYTPRTKILSNLYVYTFLLILALDILTRGKTPKYLILYLPYLCLIITLAFDQLIRYPARLRKALPLIYAGYVLINFYYTSKIIRQNENIEAENQQLAESLQIPAEARIVAPMSFVFDQIDNYQIQGMMTYKMMDEHHLADFNWPTFLKLAANHKRQFLILNDEFLEILDLPEPVPGQDFTPYRFVGEVEDHYIFKIKSKPKPSKQNKLPAAWLTWFKPNLNQQNLVFSTSPLNWLQRSYAISLRPLLAIGGRLVQKKSGRQTGLYKPKKL